MSQTKYKIIDYSSEEYADKNMKFMDVAMQAVFYNFSQEILLRNDYWRQDLNRREINQRISQGKLLDGKTKETLRQSGVKPVEPNIVTTIINNVADNTFRAHLVGRIKTLFNDKAAISAADLDLLIKMVKTDINFDKHLFELCKLGVSEAFFPFLLVEVQDDDIGRGRLNLKLYKPDAVLPDMKIFTDSGSVDDIILIDWCDRKSLYINYADKTDLLDEFNAMWGTNADYVATMSKRAVLNDRENFQKQFDALKTMPTGNPLRNRDYEVVYTWLRRMPAVVDCLINRASSNEIILTDYWDNQRIQDFLVENPSYEYVERKRYVIWETVMTTAGLVLRNRMYPIQIPTTARDVMLPGVSYVPNIVHGRPEGFIDIIKEDLVNFALAASEEQYQIFSSGGKTAYVENGAVDNPDSIRDELQNRLGVIVTTEGALQAGKIQVQPQQLNTALTQYYDNIYKRIQEYTGMSQEMQGRMQAGSSNYRTRISILQSMSSHSPFIRNLTDCDLNLTNILLYLFCLTTTDEELFAVWDTTGSEMDVKVNETAPQKVDGVWRLIRVMNDLRRGKFKYMITEQSTSSLNDEVEQEAHDAYMQGPGGHLMQTMLPVPGGVEMVANVFKQSPNSVTKRYGEMLEDSIKKGEDINANAQSVGAATGDKVNGTQTPEGITGMQVGQAGKLSAPEGEQDSNIAHGVPQLSQDNNDLNAIEQPENGVASAQTQSVAGARVADGNVTNYNDKLLQNLMNNQTMGV